MKFAHLHQIVATEKEQLIGNDGHPGLQCFVALDFLIVDGDGALVLEQQAGKMLDDGGFAGAVEAHEAVDGALRYGQAEMIQRRVSVETLCDIFYFNHSRVSFLP